MKRIRKGIRSVIIIAVLLSNVGCDQITKTVARNNLAYGENISVISGYLTLTKVENAGAFMSLGNQLPDLIKIPLLMIIPALVLIAALIFILKKRQLDFHDTVPIAFIIGGGLGNLFDRFMYGSVTDFLHMDFYIFQTGIFNLADVSIMVGVGWLLIQSLFTKKAWPNFE
jgi:signal peptidase II